MCLSKKIYNYIKTPSHTRRVQSLYKRALRNLESYYSDKLAYRYRATLLRNSFDKNADIDCEEAECLVEQGEEELFMKTHWLVRQFAESPGGTAYEREVIPPDWVLDYWYPLEKAQYPEYFARREIRKKEFVERWNKKYGKFGQC